MEIVIVVVVIVAIGVPVLAVIAFLKLESRLLRRKITEPIPGSVVITAMSNPTQGDFLPNLGDLIPAQENFFLEGVAHVPGMAPYQVRLSEVAWTNKWPKVGQTIPVHVDRRNPSRVRIRWDDLRAGRP